MNDTTPPPAQEKVLVIPRSEFDKREAFQGFRALHDRPDLGEYLTHNPAEPNLCRFMAREMAEADPRFKQIISQVVLMCGTSVLVYGRGKSGGETRLHGKLSLAVGGHVDESDDPHEPFFAYANSVLRELKEEVGMAVDHNVIQKTIIGLVNDDTSAVGKVHLGVVHVIALNEHQAGELLKNCEHTMTNPQWLPLTELGDPESQARLEDWSRHIAQHLLGELSAHGKWEDPAFRERVGMLAITAANLASAATGFLMQENARGHLLSRNQVEACMGAVTCMADGLMANEDIDGKTCAEAGQTFYQQLPTILRHQKLQADEPS